MNEPDQFPDEDIDDWYRDPSTIAKVKFLLERKASMQQKLHSCCSESTDPVVRAAYARLEEATVAIAILSPKPKKDTNGKR